MSDICPITLARYNDLEKAGLIDKNQIYQIYDTEEDMAQELMLTRKAVNVAIDELTKIKVAAESVGIGFFMTAAISALAKIKTALEQKGMK